MPSGTRARPREGAAADLAAALESAQRLDDERERLIGLCVPAGLDDLDGRRRTAEAELAAAQQAPDSADAADTHARRQLSAASARGPLGLATTTQLSPPRSGHSQEPTRRTSARCAPGSRRPRR